jgi:preprotein translocase subunit SecD
MMVVIGALILANVAFAVYWAFRPKQPLFRPAEPRVELLLQVKTTDGQVVTAVEHTIEERLGGLELSKWKLSRVEGAPSAQLLVLLPLGVDVERVKGVIQSTALLELRLVEHGRAPSQEALLEASAGQVPPDLEVLPSEETRDGNAPAYYLVQKTPVITGDDLRTARPSLDENNMPAISFSLNQEGARKLGKATGDNIGRQLAIILDGRVQSAPTINGRITTDGRITGSFTNEEVQNLSLILRSGALAAPVTLIEERTVQGSPGR